MGVAVGDYDDGFPDIYRRNTAAVLYHSNGNGTFTDVRKSRRAAPAGLQTAIVLIPTMTAASTCSRGHFAAWDRRRLAASSDGAHHYCIPRIFKPTSAGCFITTATAFSVAGNRHRRHMGKAWGVVAADINDGLMDIFVANGLRLPIFCAQQVAGASGRWTQADVAYSAEGAIGHGVTPPTNQDGWMDIFLQASTEIFSLYKNNGDLTFDDVASRWA